ncbi:hypothetical protein XENOCAPTIV_029585, partial [Xenoophorus captivus]
CVRSSRAMAPALLPRLLLPQVGFRLAGRGIWTSPLCLAVSGDSQLPPLPGQARVVICGGGIVGTSVAYHLAKLGWTDVVLLEQGRVLGISCNIIKPKEIAKLHPLVNIHDLVGALHLPDDAVVSSPDVNHALAVAAAQQGQLSENVLQSSLSFIMVSPHFLFTVHLPPRLPFLIVSRGSDSGANRHSAGRAIIDMDGRMYARPWQGGLLSGGFEKNPKPIFTEGRNQLEIQNMQEDWDHFEPMLSALLRRMPNLESAEIHQLVNCPESFTPDMRCLMGETPGVSGYYVLAGMNSSGLAFAGGAGKNRSSAVMLTCSVKFQQLLPAVCFPCRYLAEWMTYGYPTANVWPLEIKRFGSLQSSRTFLRHRVMESKTFYKPDWFDIVGAEVKCCKEAVCVIDMSSFTKFELAVSHSTHLLIGARLSAGEQALEFLQYLCANDLDVPVGHIVHTGMLNERGGYENDCSVVRLSKNSFFIISPTDQQVHCWSWIKKHMPIDPHLHLEDVSWKYTGELRLTLNLIGPRAMDVLAELSYVSMTPEHFPSMFCKEMSVGYANGIRVMSMTHTGEPGFMLYIPIEDTNFLGREALLQQRQEGVFRRFVMLVLEDHDTELDLWPWWGEPVYRSGQLAGTTTSSAYSYTLQRHVCLGFVSPPPSPEGLPTPITPDFINRGDYEVDIAGQCYPAKAKLYPFSSLFTQQKRRKEDMDLGNLHGK